IHLKMLAACLLAISVTSALSEPCAWTRHQLGRKNEESVLLLTTMGGTFPRTCVKEKGARLFPLGMFTENEDTAQLALEVMGHVGSVFNMDHGAVTWSHDQLALFRNIVHRQTEKLQACVSDRAAPGTNAALASYFQKLSGILNDKGLSACAWEIVRNEVHHTLLQLQVFLDSRKSA
uniref:Uncharacterized protein n=1 Tax=Denticeps clupeoides TaxID=299321 RepID=A0AAY4E292_9TELE